MSKCYSVSCHRKNECFLERIPYVTVDFSLSHSVNNAGYPWYQVSWQGKNESILSCLESRKRIDILFPPRIHHLLMKWVCNIIFQHSFFIDPISLSANTLSFVSVFLITCMHRITKKVFWALQSICFALFITCLIMDFVMLKVHILYQR